MKSQPDFLRLHRVTVLVHREQQFRTMSEFHTYLHQYCSKLDRSVTTKLATTFIALSELLHQSIMMWISVVVLVSILHSSNQSNCVFLFCKYIIYCPYQWHSWLIQNWKYISLSKTFSAINTNDSQYDSHDSNDSQKQSIITSKHPRGQLLERLAGLKMTWWHFNIPTHPS